MGCCDWEYTLLQAAEEARRTGEFKGGVREPIDLINFLAAAAQVWDEAADNNANDLEEFTLQEKTPDGEVVRTVAFQLHNREQAEEMANHRLAVALDSDNHWEVV